MRESKLHLLVKNTLLSVLLFSSCIQNSGDRKGGRTGDGQTPQASPNINNNGDAVSQLDLPANVKRCIGTYAWFAISGRDNRGDFMGAVDFCKDRSNCKIFNRVIDYNDAYLVEDNRKVSAVIQGEIVGNSTQAQLSSSLRVADFVIQRNNLKRSDADKQPLILQVPVNFDDACRAQMSFNTGRESWTETWQPGAGIYPVAEFKGFMRSSVPSMDVPGAAEKATITTLFKSYANLPAVQPYAARPEFTNIVNFAIRDQTDLDFYRARPDRLRLRNKIIDEISLAEEKSRADAFRYNLAQKVDIADRMVKEKFFDNEAKVLGFGIFDGIGWGVSGDGALWQGMYLVGQYFKYQVTKDPETLNFIRELAEGILRLQDVTGDPKQFARTIRKRAATQEANWKIGYGAFSNLEWLTGGNNDMSKGIILGLAYSWKLFCVGQNEADQMCVRIKRNAQWFNDQVSGSLLSENQLLVPWLAAWVTKSDGNSKYLLKAQAAWTVAKPVLETLASNSVKYGQGDWSGLNLGLSARLAFNLLMQEYPLPLTIGAGDMKTSFDSQVRSLAEVTEKSRFLDWLVAGSGWVQGPAERKQDAAMRLIEFPIPKPRLNVDHRVNPEFSMNAIPSHPWKNDWTEAGTDRTQDYRVKPMFEIASREWALKDSGKEYIYNSTAFDASTADYSFIYWFARYLNVISATD